MENKEDNIEDLFRERFENDEVTVSPKVWQNIKKTLPDDKDSIGFGFSLNAILWSIAGILILSAVIGSYLHLSPNKSSVYSSQQTTSASVPNTYGTKSTNLGSAHDSLSAADSHQDAIRNAAYQNSSDNYSKESNSSTFSSRSSNGNNSFLKKENKATTSKNTIDSGDEQDEPKNQQKEKLTVTDNLNSTSANKNEKTASVLYKKQHASVDQDKDNTTKDQNQTLQSKFSFADTEKKSTASNTVTKNTLGPSENSVQMESKLAETKGKNNLPAQTDTLQWQSNDTSISSKPAIDSVLVHTSVAQDSLNKNKAEAIVKNNRDKESSITAHDSHSTALRNDTLTTNVVLYSAALTDSSLLNPTTSYEQTVNKDSLSEIETPPLLAQDSALAKLDSLKNILPDSALAKTTANKEKDQPKLWNRLSFDLLATALVTGASISTSATDSITPSAIEDKNRNDKNSLGYSAGIMVNYKLSDRIHASAGIGYTLITEQYHFTYTLKQSNWVFIDTAWQLVEYDSIYRDFNVKDQYSFLSIPLQLSYTFLQKGKLKLSAAVGLRSNILIKGATYLANAQKSDVIKVTSGFNKISFMYQLSLEAAYQWNERMALVMQPTFVYGATSIHTKSSSLQQKPYGVGLTIGLRFTF